MTHWSVLGAGSLGSLWACYLSQHHSVSLITRQACSDSRMILNKQNQDTSFTIHKKPAEKLSQDIDHLLLCTKAYDALPAIQSVASRLNKQSRILLLQNGMGSQQAIADAFPELAIYAASCTEGAYKTHSHRVVHAGLGQTLYGPLTDSARNHPLDIKCNLQLGYCENIQPVISQKLAINCAINGLTCIYDCKNGGLLDGKGRQEHLLALCDEIQQVIGNQLPEEINIYALACQVARDTAQNISSMRQDMLNKKATEIDYINGYLQTLADNKNLNTLVNQKLLLDIKNLEKNYL